MRKIFFALLSMAVTCTVIAQSNSSAKVPKELIGHWQLGTFSLTSFWNPTTGQYLGNASEGSRSYQIAADGTAEEFFIYNSTSYNCRTQILGYRKGTIKINANKSFTFCPTTGYYRSANCFKKEWQKKEYGEKDLYPAYQVTYFWSVQDDKLIVKDNPDATTVTTYRKISGPVK
jgi:hypothetical protein